MNGDKKKTLRDFFGDGALATFGDKSANADGIRQILGGHVGGHMYGQEEEGGERIPLGELLRAGPMALQLTQRNREDIGDYWDTKGAFGYVSPEQDTTYFQGGRAKSQSESASRSMLRSRVLSDLLSGNIDEYEKIDLEEGQTIDDWLDQFSGYRDERTAQQPRSQQPRRRRRR
jgi:hypothetical protein